MKDLEHKVEQQQSILDETINMKKSPLQRRGQSSGSGLSDWLDYSAIAEAGKPRSLTGEALVQLGALFTQIFPDDLIEFGKKEKEVVPTSEIKYTKGDEREGVTDPEALTNQIKGGWEEYLRNKSNKSVITPPTPPKDPPEDPPEDPPQDPPPIPPQDENHSLFTFENLFPTFGRDIHGNIISHTPIGLDPGLTPEQKTLSKIRIHFDKRNKERKAAGDVSSTVEMAKYIRSLEPSEQNIFAKSIGKESWLDLDSLTDRDFEEYLLPGTYGRIGNAFTVSPTNRLKEKFSGDTGSLLKRLDSNTLEILKKLSYTRRGDDDSPLFRVAHVATSPFTKTDTDKVGNRIGYRYMRRAVIPEYAQGSLGTAAADGYNLAIDKYNYNQAVEEDFENLLVEETKGLDIDVDYAGADFQADYLQAVQGIKKDVSNAVIDYAQGKISKMELEALRTKSKARVQRFAAAGNQLKNLRADYIDKIEKGLIDPKASQGEHTDLFNTLYKAPDNLTVKTIDGIDYVVGKTLQNKDIKVAVSKIADGTTGLGVIPKADIDSLVATAKASIKAATKEGKTAYGVGAIGASLEEAERISKEIFEAKLRNDETFLRGAVSRLAGIDYDAYEAATEGPEKAAELDAMIQDTAQAIFNQEIKPGYTQQTRTTRFTTEGSGGTTQGERKVAEIKSKLNALPPPNTGNIDTYMTLLELNKGEAYQVKNNKLIIGDIKAGIALRTIDLSNPSLAKSQIANLAGVLGYGLSGQVQNKLTEEQIKARAFQLLSNAGL